MFTIEEIRSGDETAFAALYNCYHPKLYVFFYKKTGSSYLSEELLQLAFIKFWNSRHTLKNDLSADVQLFQIAKTTLIDLLRKEASQRGRLTELSREQTKEPSYDPSAAMEVGDEVKNILNSLSPIKRKILQLSREQGFSHQEIAMLLSITTKAVENHIARALKQIKHFLFLLF